MAKKQETKTASLKSVEEKLKALYQLQLIDSEVDRIRTVRGELPLEIEDLQDSIEAYSKRKEKVVQEIDLLQHLPPWSTFEQQLYLFCLYQDIECVIAWP